MPAGPHGRPFRIQRPWPTGPRQSNRIIRIAAILVFLQFLLKGLGHVLTGPWMLAAWTGIGAAAALSTMKIEKYLAKQRRGSP